MELTINFNFRNEIINEDFSLNYCFQCSTCSSGCPVAFLTGGKYNPRKIIEASLLGFDQFLLNINNSNLFLCSTCQKCVELCPQKVELTEIFNIIKNKIVDIEKYPTAYRSQAQMIIENGVAIPISMAIQRRRDKLSLPNVQIVDINELKTILQETGLIQKLKINFNENET
ncbi:MAG: 4Fe-4S dicluster domain-containing protein [Candidatus Helarchaeota archaeon]